MRERSPEGVDEQVNIKKTSSIFAITMTRLILFPNESAQINLESNLTAEELVRVIQAGAWQPPEGIRAALPGLEFLAIRLGRNTVLAYAPARPGEQEEQLPALSTRQVEILQSLADGLTLRQVGLALGISRRTVFMHLAAIRRNLNAQTTQEALLRAAALGLCRPQRNSTGG